MSEPAVAVVYDSEGREHYAGSSSKFVVNGLRDGTLTTERPAPPEKSEEDPESSTPGTEKPEVASGPEVQPPGDDQKSDGVGGDGSGVEATDSAPAGRNSKRSRTV